MAENFGFWPCCEPPIGCSLCTDPLPDVWRVAVSGITDSDIFPCEDLNGTHDLTVINSAFPCFWTIQPTLGTRISVGIFTVEGNIRIRLTFLVGLVDSVYDIDLPPGPCNAVHVLLKNEAFGNICQGHPASYTITPVGL